MREQGGTIDLDERSTAWRAEGWGADTPHSATGGTAGAMAAQALLDGDRIAPTAQRNDARSSDTLTDAERSRLAGSTQGVRVMRRMSETPVSELVRLRQERATVDRRSVDRAGSAADLEVDRLSRQADDALGRATGDAYDEDDALARTPNTTPRTPDRGRSETPDSNRKT